MIQFSTWDAYLHLVAQGRGLSEEGALTRKGVRTCISFLTKIARKSILMSNNIKCTILIVRTMVTTVGLSRITVTVVHIVRT